MSECVLYRHFTKGGKLLYVGVSKNALARLRGHEGGGWYDQIARVTMQHFDSRSDAMRAEREAIQSENPEHNKMRYNVDYPSPPVVRQRDEHQLYPAGCAFVAMHIACRDVEACMASGGNPYVDNWRRDGYKGFEPDTPLADVEIDDEEASE